MKQNKDILHYLKEEAEKIEIPESITPEQMRKRLEQKENEKQEKIEYSWNDKFQTSKKKEKFRKDYLYQYLVAAACLCLLIGSVIVQKTNVAVKKHTTGLETENLTQLTETDKNGRSGIKEEKEEVYVEVTEDRLLASIEYPEITYEDIYESMFGNWEEMKYQISYRGDMPEGAIVVEDGAIPEAPAADVNTNIVFKEYAADEAPAQGMLAESSISEKAAEKNETETKQEAAEYGTTNVRTQGVEEADVVKNDGRYLYQKIYQDKGYVHTQAIQIVDTKDGLTEVKRIEGYDNIQEFYVWEDTLVIIENKYLETMQTETQAEKLMVCGAADYGSYNRQFHEITFYNIKDRSKPYKIKTFTLKGRYDSSRIADGYFYGFSKYYASPGEGEKDYTSYIPQVDGIKLEAEQILLPEENEGNCYLLLTSIDMRNPRKFVDITAIVTDSDMYYVSRDNIYLADCLPMEQTAGKQTNRISLLRFSYEKGKFGLQAEGIVPGSLESSFSMDEYEGYLRMVTTVDEYLLKEIKDDITGEILGNYIENETRSNALYVLDSDLSIIGKIENLAENERIYSARFMGDTGYFVTFRQTDPLFAVDLADVKNPKILSELKISGFSEYLHFYGEDRLLGIGMEADEETGSTDGMKLSMFDISDPANVQELTKLHMEQYQYSEALYNHKAVMISVPANIFGFEVEGYENGNFKKDYLVFSYENDAFVQKLKVETNNKYGEMYSSRGTFIGNVFYLLTRNGDVTSYDLKTGNELERLQ